MNAKTWTLLGVLLLSTVPGCGPPKENTLATDGATAEDIAKYEEELAAVSGDDSYADAEGDDAAE